MSSRSTLRWLALLVVLVGGLQRASSACPFCTAVAPTWRDEMAQSNYVVLVRMLDMPPAADPPAADPSTAERGAAGSAATAPPVDAMFEIVEVLKAAQPLAKKQQVKLMYVAGQPSETRFLVLGSGEVDPVWSTPTALSERGAEYMSHVARLDGDARSRLRYLQDYLQDADAMLANDAYGEFAKAPYADVRLIKDQMHRERLRAWIVDPAVDASRRRLYFTMLGICGTPEDALALEGMIQSNNRQERKALDAMIAGYLNLKGGEGMPLIENLFLKETNPRAEYIDTFSAVAAIRFHLQETEAVPKQRLLEGLRHILERNELAELVIPDLARWQDWSAMDRLVELFKAVPEESTLVRALVISYLLACPMPEAKVHVDELAKIDPKSVQRARKFAFVETSKKPATVVQDSSKNAPAMPPPAVSSSGRLVVIGIAVSILIGLFVLLWVVLQSDRGRAAT